MELALITTGIEKICEGITISSLKGPSTGDIFTPIMRASDGQIVTGLYDRDGCRVMVDGGFKRLYSSYCHTTAGTERFVQNSACYLVNLEERRRKRIAVRADEIADKAKGGGGAN